MSEYNLFEGENYLKKYGSDEETPNLSDEEINKKYRKGEMRIVTEQGRIDLHSITTILDSTSNGKRKYILNPEYQRRKRWDSVRKSRLIESFIMNVPIPPIFLYEIEYAVYEVMDGLQRLTTIYDFYKEKYKLEGLQYWKELNGKKYGELPENVRAGIDRRYLSSIILLEETAKNKEEAEFLKQIVFERLNSGGETLTPQETRNAMYNGKFNKLCIELAKNDLFRKMWNLPLESEGEKALLANEQYRKMADIELVLRFFAYRHVDKLTPPLDNFLDNFLNQANQFPDSTIEQLKSLFEDTVEVIYTIWEEDAFLKPKTAILQYNSPTKTIYDPIMQAVAQNIQYKDILISKKEELRDNIYSNKEDLIRDKKNNNNLFDGRYNNRVDVQDRICELKVNEKS